MTISLTGLPEPLLLLKPTIHFAFSTSDTQNCLSFSKCLIRLHAFVWQYSHLSFPTPVPCFRLILLRSSSGVSFPKRSFLSTSNFHPKAKTRLQCYNPTNFACFYHNYLLSIYLLICLSRIKDKDRVCFIFLCPISRISSVTEQTIN